jgi:glucose-1-phosphate thymidylyltransferase
VPDLGTRMVGVILAAGKGARMFPFSEQYPKPILPILNRPLIARQIEVMRDLGLTTIYVVVGHLGYQIAGVLGHGESLGVDLHMVGQEGTLGLAHAVGALEPYVQSPFLLMLGDIHFHLNSSLRPLIDDVFEGRSNASLVSMYEPDPAMVRRNFVIQADDERRVSRVIEKPRYVDSQLKGCGLYVFDQHIFDAIRRTPRTAMRDEYEITTSIQILIDDGYVVKHHPIVERDLNMTKPDDLLLINLLELKWHGLTSLVDPTAVISAGAQIENSVIGAHVQVRHPIRIANSVIMPGIVVDSTTDLDAVVISGEHTVHCPAAVAGLRL